MENLAQKIRDIKVEAGQIALFWIAQAGFVYKTHDGVVIYVDPYLTDYVERALPEYGFGFKRVMPKLIDPEDVEADFIISTHSHQDHFDVDAMPILLKNPNAHFIGAPDCEELYIKCSVPAERFTIIHKNETIKFKGFNLTGVFADHGELAPHALGLLFDFDGIHSWHVGDSAYRPELWRDLFKRNIDILLPPINGAFGNLNGVEAAKLANDAAAKWVIPCHFWMFALHYGNPAEFLEACKTHAPKVRPYLMTPGECIFYNKQ